MSNEPSRPTEFQVAHRKYTVHYINTIKEGQPDLVGYADHNSNMVLISENQVEADMQETVVHEILHCSLVALGELKLNADERFVARLSAVLAQALLSLK